MSAVTKSIFAFILFGLTPLIFKRGNLNPQETVFWRMLIAALLTTFVVLFKRATLPRGKSLLLCVVAALTMSSNMVLLFSSYQYSPTGICVQLYYLSPLFTVLLRVVWFREKLGRLSIIASVTAIVALALLLAEAPWRESRSWLGYLMAVGAGLISSFTPLLEREQKADSRASFLVQAWICSLLLLPFLSVNSAALTPQSLGLILILGVFLTFLPFMLWWQALREDYLLSPFVLYASPVTAALVSLFVLHEPYSPAQLVSLLLLTGSCFLPLVERARRPIA